MIISTNQKKASQMKLLIVALLTIITAYHLRPLPEVWFGDRTHQCIVIIQTDGTQTECPEDMSTLPRPHTPIYVIEETDYE
jgi:hypothetical protein